MTYKEHGDDVIEIDALLRRQEEAWAKDAVEFADTFTADADFVAVNGELISGRDKIVASLQEGFTTFMAGTRMSSPSERAIRFPLPNFAVMITSGVGIIRPGEDSVREEALSIQTRTAIRQEGRWLFTTFHNSRMWS
ncbi:SgcJ/EcaC family oxidoreductase [Brevibacterium picturae]